MIIQNIFSGEEYIWEGFEKENLWLIGAFKKNMAGTIGISSVKKSEGRKSLKISIQNTQKGQKGFITREGFFDFTGIHDIIFDVYVYKPSKMSLGLTTGPAYQWFESQSIKLNPGWNKNIRFKFNEKYWKSEETLWRHTSSVDHLSDLRRIIFILTKGEKQKVYIDNIRLSGRKINNSAYDIPYEPLKTGKMRDGFHLLKGIKKISLNNGVSGKIIKRNKRQYTLLFSNIDDINRITYPIKEKYMWKDISKIVLKLKNNSKKDIYFTSSFQTKEALHWYESPKFLLKSGKNTKVIVNLNAPYYKCEETEWQNSSFLYDKDDIRIVNFLVYAQDHNKASGKIEVKDFKLMKGRRYLPKREKNIPLYIEKIDKRKYKNPKITKVLNFKQQVSQYEKVELSFNLAFNYKNPYNPEEIYCEAEFSGPNNRVYKVPGFYYEDFSSKENNNSLWKIRFTPKTTGFWKFRLKIKNPGGKTVLKKTNFNFNCIKAKHKGFIITKGQNFIFEDGSYYYPYGLALAWVVPQDRNDFFSYLNKYYNSGMNWTRIWNVPWDLKLEWTKPIRYNLGKYSQKDAHRWDQIIDYAREKGIYIQFCMNNFTEFQKNNNWKKNPYAYLNGGPAKSPGEFFTSEMAKKYFKRKLLYMIARWGYADSILAWELFNEVDLCSGYNEKNVYEWHKEMASYIKQVDSHKHLVTTSFSKRLAGTKVFSLPDIDYSQTHVYTEDFYQALFTFPFVKMKQFKKPHLTAEIGGLIEKGEEEVKDKQGIRIHNALWYAFFSCAPSSAMYWWWDEYVEKNDLYYHFKIFKELLEEIDYKDRKKIELEIDTKGLGNYTFSPLLDWERSTGKNYKIDNNELIGDGLLSKYLQGACQKKWINDPIFDIDFKKDAELSIHIVQSSVTDANLSIKVDEERVFTKFFPMNTVPTSNDIDKIFTVKIPKGSHKVQILSDGQDWVSFKWLKFSNCVFDVEAYALKSGPDIYIWIKNREFNMDNVLNDRYIKVSEPGIIKIEKADIKKSYRIYYYDTWNKKLISTKPVLEKNHTLEIPYPGVEKDILVIIKKME